MKRVVLAAAIVVLAGCTTAERFREPIASHRAPGSSLLQQSAYSVNPHTQRIVDQHGRERYFHGANVVEKSFPFIPNPDAAWNWNTTFTAKDMQLMQELGLNAIRLGTMWPGIEPARGVYNSTYLSTLSHVVEMASEYGIHSLLDMHQDLMSEKFCGEGFPLWAVYSNVADSKFPWPLQPDPFPVDARGVPRVGSCPTHWWGEYYFTLGVAQGFQHFYDNWNGTLDAWAAAWGEVASVAKGLGAAVLGRASERAVSGRLLQRSQDHDTACRG